MPFTLDDAAVVPNFKGTTLLIADVSRGNVGQLAADLLVTTLQMQRVGYFNDPDVLPAVGLCTRVRLLSLHTPPGDRKDRACTHTTTPLTTAGFFPHPALTPCSHSPRLFHSALTQFVAREGTGIENGKLRVNTELFATHDCALFVLQQRYLTV